MWSRLAAQIRHFFTHSAESSFSQQKVPYFNVSPLLMHTYLKIGQLKKEENYDAGGVRIM